MEKTASLVNVGEARPPTPLLYFLHQKCSEKEQRNSYHMNMTIDQEP
jgi:hypothetical protein